VDRTILEGFAFAALFLAGQFVILTLAYLDLSRLDGKPLWLHPGVAVAAGFAAAGLLKLVRLADRRIRPVPARERRP
jgi:hypothetical protein